MRSHARLLKLGLDKDPVTVTRFLQDCLTVQSPESLHYARHLFDQVPLKDNSLWTAMVSAYARSNQPAEAVHLLSQMHRLSDGPRPNHYVYASAARAVGSIANPRLAKTVHSQVLKHGFQSNVVVGTSVLDMYAKCYDIVSAGRMFDEMPERNIVTWNSMISGCVTGGMGFRAFELFFRMRCVELEDCDEFTVASVLTACAGIGDMRLGMQIHGYSVGAGFEADLATKNAVANMYFRCGEVEWAIKAMEGRQVDVISKIMMIKGFTFNGRYNDAVRSINDGKIMDIVERDCSVIVSILSACANLSMLRMGMQVHGLILTLGNSQNHCSTDAVDVILRSALIDMYFRCSKVGEARLIFGNLLEKNISDWNSMIVGCIHNGILDEARMFFDEMPERSAISWTTMMSGYVQHGFPQEALRLLANYYNKDNLVQGNCSVLATSLDACSCLASLDVGKQIHAMALRLMAESKNIVVETALVDMYSKSGNFSCAQKIFNRMGKRNVVSWTSMITACAFHGSGFEAVKLFEEMLKMGLEPNEITFVAVLNACSHCGLIEEGVQYFKMMKKFGIVPTGDHYTCMVDMLVRVGKLDVAWSLAKDIKYADTNYEKTMKINKGREGSIWGALLGGCWLHGNVELGSKVADKMLENKQQTSDAYVALSNVFATAELWNEVYRVREEWRNHGVAKEPGHSQIQIGYSR